MFYPQLLHLTEIPLNSATVTWLHSLFVIENRNNVKVLNMRENPDIWHQSSKQVILAIKVQKTAKGSHTVFKENLTSDIRKLKTTALYKDNLATGECYKEGIDAWETDRLSGDRWWWTTKGAWR